MRLAFSASGILLVEQSQPRHKDLKAGIWMRSCSSRIIVFAPFVRKCKGELFTVIHKFSMGRTLQVIAPKHRGACSP